MKQKKGFSLLELLVVIAITGVLVSMATAAYATAQKKARDARRKTQLTAVQQALEQYYQANLGSYPASCSSLDASYLPSGMPTDPKTNLAYDTFSGNSCTSQSFCLCAGLEGETNSQKSCTGGSPPAGFSGFYCVRNLQ